MKDIKVSDELYESMKDLSDRLGVSMEDLFLDMVKNYIKEAFVGDEANIGKPGLTATGYNIVRELHDR